MSLSLEFRVCFLAAVFGAHAFLFVPPVPLSSPAVYDRCASLCDFAVSFAVLRWLRRPLFEVPATLCRPLLARAAAANVDPRTQLSHVTEIPQCVTH